MNNFVVADYTVENKMKNYGLVNMSCVKMNAHYFWIKTSKTGRVKMSTYYQK